VARHYRGCLNPPTCSQWDHNYNWWDATGTYPTNPYDGYGHGTHISGTMVGDDGGSNQIGMAPGAQTIHCKNMTDGGSGNDGTLSECFEWDLAPWDLNGLNPDPAMAPDAINNSWGYWGGNDPEFKDEIQALHAAGILVEVSAGNEGSGCYSLRSPGDYWEVLTTGSVNHFGSFPGTITGFSSRGPSDLDGDYFPDIMAPGESVRSSLPGNSYAAWSGTSMAGPHATALVGLMWSANPGLRGQVEATIDIIRGTAVPLTGQHGSNCGGDYTVGPNNDWGMGTIDSLAAVTAVSGPSILVQNIEMRIFEPAPDWFIVLSFVRIIDEDGAPVEGATVDVEWTLPWGQTRVGQKDTNANGWAWFSAFSWQSGTYQVCVTGVGKAGFVYDPDQNWETCDSIPTPP
jgi:subtilisin family serine protease